MKVKVICKYLLSKWYVFVAWAVLSAVFWLWIVDLITRPTAEQKLSVFVCSESCEQSSLLEELGKVRPEYAVQLDFKWVRPNDNLFGEYYDAFAVYGGDIIIMPKSKLSEISYVDYFELDVEKVESRFGKTEYYYAANGNAYGIEIEVEKSIGAQASGDTYYLFFNKNSLHLGDWTGSPRDGALILAQVFI